MHKLFGIGWDVRGWQGTQQATSVALLSPSSSKIEWLGTSVDFSFKKGTSPNLMDLLEPAVGFERAESIEKENCVTQENR